MQDSPREPRRVALVTLGALPIGRCAVRAGALLSRYPLRWTAVILVFVLVTELCMLVPHVGLVCKLMVSALLGAQMLVLFDEVRHGRPPRLRRLFDVVRLPAAGQAALVAGALAPMFAALAYIALRHGMPVVATFFATKSAAVIATPVFFEFKIAMFIASLPFTFTGASVALAGFTGWPALLLALRAAARNPAPPVLLIASTVAAEHLLQHIPQWWPGLGGIVVAAVWTLLFLAWALGWTCTLGKGVLGLDTPAIGVLPDSAAATADRTGAGNPGEGRA